VGAYRRGVLTQATSATLTFSSRVRATSTTTGNISLQISSNNGAAWTTLDTFSFSTLDSGLLAKSYDIGAYATAFTMIRFIGSGTVYGYLYVDDLQIEYTRLSNAYVFSVLANNVWKSNTTPGSGVTVAVVDSGIASHTDLAGSLLTSVDFSSNTSFTYDALAAKSVQTVTTNSLLAGDTGLTGTLVGDDEYGHGTHVAGIVAGSGQASGGSRVGNAPFVSLINVKVTGADGSGYLSNLISGLQWIYENAAAYNIKVVNISMNSAVPEPYNSSPVDAAVEILWFNGITVVVSAGNNGIGTGPVPLLPPANDPFVITVGAADDMGTFLPLDDTMTTFSAYGTTEDGFAKPDLVAPGRNIISLLSSTSSNVYVNHPANRVDDYYFRMSGTSMAAPMVTGAVALMLQRNPALNPDQIKYRLRSTASKTWAGYDAAKAGAGYLNAFAAVFGNSTQAANTGIKASAMLSTGSDPITWNSVGWNSVGWNSVGWNSVGWNSVGWNSVGWNSVGWNSDIWGP
jgi:serine protease AprX